jgi:hypothetical protein
MLVDDDRVLFGWVRYYAGVLVLFTLFGLALAAVYRVVGRPYAEAWSVVIQTEERIPALQLGFVSQSVFRSASVYRPVMRELEIDTSPERFFDEQAELRPVAETDALIVIGRAPTEVEAERVSARLTEALIEVFKERDLSTLEPFGRAVPIPEDISDPVALAIGGTGGFWLGLGASLIHYRLRRPVLDLHRAAAITAPQRVTLLDGPWPRWLGALRPLGRAEEAARNGEQPHTSSTRRGSGGIRSPESRDTGRRLVASPRTSERTVDELLATSLDRGDGPWELVWIR